MPVVKHDASPSAHASVIGSIHEAVEKAKAAKPASPADPGPRPYDRSRRLPSRSHPDAVVFDFYGTIAWHGEAAASPYATVFSRHGYRLDEAVEADYFATYDGIEHAEHSTSEAVYESWVRGRLAGLARTCGVRDDDLAPLIDALRSQDVAPVVPYPDAAETLGTLRDLTCYPFVHVAAGLTATAGAADTGQVPEFAATAPATPEFAIATTGLTPNRFFHAPSTDKRPAASVTISTSAAHNCSPKRSWTAIRTASFAAQRPSSQS